MATTIQVSDDVKKRLDKMKLFEREAYNDVIDRMMEDTLELSDETEKSIQLSIKQIKDGKFVTQEEMMKRFG